MEIQLPDYLPARYKNWLTLYLDVIHQFNERGYPITEDTKVKLYELGDHQEQAELLEQYGESVVHFYQEFPLTLIKARALDFILPNLPTKNAVYRLHCDLMTVPFSSGTLSRINQNSEIIEKLMAVCPRDESLY